MASHVTQLAALSPAQPPALTALLSHAGPLLLNALLKYLGQGGSHAHNNERPLEHAQPQDVPSAPGSFLDRDSSAYGCCLVALLGLTAVLKVCAHHTCTWECWNEQCRAASRVYHDIPWLERWCGRRALSVRHTQGVLNTQYSFRRGALACQLRAALSVLVFDKTLMVSTADMAGFSAGTVQTLMSVDADRVVNMFSWMHELWSLPLQIVIALGLLYTQARARC